MRPTPLVKAALLLATLSFVACADENGISTDGGADKGVPTLASKTGTGGSGGSTTKDAGTGSDAVVASNSAGDAAPVAVTATGGTSGSSGSGGVSGSGGLANTGGAVATGGGGTAGQGTGGAAVVSSGGSAGGGTTSATGGAATAGAATGGKATGGANTAGAGAGGTNTGGASTGGAATGGTGTGGAATGGKGTGGAATGGANTGGAASVPPASLYVVAHPDDELLFMNPDLETDILAGGPVTTVYLTSGDGGDPNSDWRGRETRVMTAHALMAGLANTWSCAAATYATKATVRCTLAARPSLRAIFLRVLDGGIGDLRALGVTGTKGTIDNSATYTIAQLLATLGAIQTELGPARVGMLDGTLAHGSDHVDHISGGIFMLDAARTDGAARLVTMYRGYSMFEPSFATGTLPAPAPENLSATQYQEKLRIVLAYQAPPLDSGFDEWCHRLYPIRGLTGVAGPLHSAAGQCLAAGGTASGSAVTVAACVANNAAQSWTVGANGRITGQGGKCLGLAATGTAAVIETCNTAAADQRWTLFSDGQLHGTGDTCLTLSGTSISATTCAADMSTTTFVPLMSQRWTL